MIRSLKGILFLNILKVILAIPPINTTIIDTLTTGVTVITTGVTVITRGI